MLLARQFGLVSNRDMNTPQTCYSIKPITETLFSKHVFVFVNFCSLCVETECSLNLHDTSSLLRQVSRNENSATSAGCDEWLIGCSIASEFADKCSPSQRSTKQQKGYPDVAVITCCEHALFALCVFFFLAQLTRLVSKRVRCFKTFHVFV